MSFYQCHQCCPPQAFERVAKALADPRRFAILGVIAEGELSCGALVARCPVSQATVSHHLKILLAADLVAVRRAGQHGYFRFRPEVLRAYLKEVRRRLVG